MTKLTPAQIEDIRQTTRKAAKAIMAVYDDSQNLEVTTKSDNTPVTQADIAAHEIIMAGLSRLDPTIPIVSEEGDAGQNRQHLQSPNFWLVDPLDGTRAFIAKKTGQFAICIALIVGDDPVFGIISAPALEKTYFGGPKYGSYRENEPKPPVDLAGIDKKPSRAVMTSSNLFNQPTKEYIDKNYPDYELKNVGSQLKLPYMAEGFADVYPRIDGPLHTWDLAAGHAILEGAGGQVSRFSGQKINYRSPDMKAGDFIARRFRQET